jgi:hypothetical protein
MTTNFITPPDFVSDPNHTILLVDVDPVDVETLAHLCAGHDESFNIYLFKEGMSELGWYDECVALAHAIIVNTNETELSPAKDQLVDMPKTFHYGPKNFLNNPRGLENFLDYFIQRANERQSQTSSTL